MLRTYLQASGFPPKASLADRKPLLVGIGRGMDVCPSLGSLGMPADLYETHSLEVINYPDGQCNHTCLSLVLQPPPQPPSAVSVSVALSNFYFTV